MAPDPLRGRRGHPRLRQHRRRGGRQRARAAGRAAPSAGFSTSAAASAVTTREFADIVMRQYGSDRAGRGDRRVPLRRYPAHPAPTSAPSGRWAGNRARTPAESVAAYAGVARRAWTAWTGYSPRPTRGCAPSAWSAGRRREGLPPRRRASAAACGRSPTPPRSACWPSTAGRCSTSGSTRSTRRASTRCSSTCTTCRRWCAATWPSATGSAVGPHVLRARAARQRGHAARQPRPGWTAKSSSWPATPTTSPTSTCRSLIKAHREHGAIATLAVFHSAHAVGGRSRGSSTPTGTVTGFAEKPSDAGLRPGERRHVRLPAERARRDRRRAAAGHRLRPAAAAGGPRPGRARSTGTSATSAPPTPTDKPGRSGPDGPRHDHHPDALAHRPARRRDRPARATTVEHGGRVLNCAIDKYIYVIVEAALRRRHLRQLLQEGDRLPGRGPRARAGPRGHADDRRDRRRGDHHAGRHPVGRAPVSGPRRR